MARKVFTDESLATFVEETKAYSDANLEEAKEHTEEKLVSYYTKEQIDGMELISEEDIDAICGASIVSASEEGVKF